jgi:seryl-tRNA synthetase
VNTVSSQVNSYTIKLTLNKDARWTKALKFLLADLKVRGFHAVFFCLSFARQGKYKEFWSCSFAHTYQKKKRKIKVRCIDIYPKAKGFTE